MIGIYLGLAGYFILILGVSYASVRYRPVRSVGDFIVGKGFGSVVSGLAAGSTLASGYAFIGLVALGYTLGFLALYQAIFAPFLDLVCWRYLAPKVRRLSEKHKALTPVDLLSKLNGDAGKLIKVTGGLVVAIFMFAYLGSNFIAAGKAATALNLDYRTATIVSSVVVILYTMVGGVTAVYWTDAIQGALMLAMCILMPVVAIAHIGGFGEFLRQLHQIQPVLVSWTSGKAGWPLFAALWLWLGVGVGFLGQPQGIQKFITIKNEEKIPGAAVVAIIFNTVRQYFPILLGLSCRVLFPAIGDPELSTPSFINRFFPNVMGGLMLAAIFAAIMSTTSALLLQGTSELVRNVMQTVLFRKPHDEGFYTRLSQWTTLLFGIVALGLALAKVDTVFYLTLLAWSGLAASFGPGLFATIFWRKTTQWGVLAGIIAGTLNTFIWYNGGNRFFGLHEGLPSFLIATAAVILVSLMTKRSRLAPELEP